MIFFTCYSLIEKLARGCLRPSLLAAVLVIPSGASPLADSVEHVLHISLDGLGGTYLKAYLSESPAEFPALTRLARQGAQTFNARCDYNISLTEPNHSSMFTGRPVLQQPAKVSFSAPHGFTANYDPGPPWTLHNFGNLAVPYKASVFDVVHDHGGSTGFYAGKQKFDLFARSYDSEHGAPDLIPPDDGTAKMDALQIIDWVGPDIVRAHDSNLVSLVIERLTTNAPAYTFLHLADPDITGHYYLWGSPEYREAVRELDHQLTRILSVIDSNPALSNQIVILLTADHGGGDAAGSHIYPDSLPVYTIPMLLWGPGVPAGLDLYALFANRTDPGTQYLDYDAPQQPLRNGDTGNIALTLLGLPPIPGSCLIAEPRLRLYQERSPWGLMIWWTTTDASADLEWAEGCSGPKWAKVTDGIIALNGWSFYMAWATPETAARFYRLAQAAPQQP